MRKPRLLVVVMTGVLLFASQTNAQTDAPADHVKAVATTIASAHTKARAADGKYISWREHIIDDQAIGGVAIRGGDGLALVDLDLDGHLDIVSVHESDTQYDGVADGHVRLAFGTADPKRWELVTLGEGAEVGAAEDIAVGDMTGDGYPDLVIACELAHLIYFQNPGRNCRTLPWQRTIPKGTKGRGSFIRVYLADFGGDGKLEAVTANKGVQSPTGKEAPNPISWFEIVGNPLKDSNWIEHELTRVGWPINSQPVDLDGDGDLDVIGGSVTELRIMWFENVSGEGGVAFRERPIDVAGTSLTGSKRPMAHRNNARALVNGFNMDFVDLNGDKRLDIVLSEGLLLGASLVWLEQPQGDSRAWKLHTIGDYAPDELVGIRVADVNGDGRADVMTGGYSRGPRDKDGDVTRDDPLGRLAWFEHPDNPTCLWIRHDISRRKRGMFDGFVAHDLDRDGDLDFISTRGNSASFDGVFWLEQIRTRDPARVFTQARSSDSLETGLPPGK